MRKKWNTLIRKEMMKVALFIYDIICPEKSKSTNQSIIRINKRIYQGDKI